MEADTSRSQLLLLLPSDRSLPKHTLERPRAHELTRVRVTFELGVMKEEEERALFTSIFSFRPFVRRPTRDRTNGLV